MKDPMVSVAWLAEHLDQVDVLDASYLFPADSEQVQADFLKEHIATARLFEIDVVCDQNSDLPHMLPNESVFAEAMAAQGIEGNRPVVVYDRSVNHFSAPRVWYTLRAFGLKDCYVLDGGLRAWIQAGNPLESGEPKYAPVSTRSWRFDPSGVISGEALAQRLKQGAEVILDARALNRFNGEVAEPRPGLQAGHMPNARCIPFNTLTDEAGYFLSPERLEALFNMVNKEISPIVTCGSGMTACVLALGLARIGVTARLYDGSWVEWGQGKLGEIHTA
ncbi:sulfurtransferase [Maribrevibacterium harenarium]|uniref:Sulfurtransferase n=1 Tax=Maribrevibacterium harenarium TaxID=2589817 RepID=A0A501WJP2_9GAMM|nr:sulfurtransferase [Maribrevibacterium harenarium]TPE48580.1 sulfurtransferase [Maribrevibacterium harenarium]